MERKTDLLLQCAEGGVGFRQRHPYLPFLTICLSFLSGLWHYLGTACYSYPLFHFLNFNLRPYFMIFFETILSHRSSLDWQWCLYKFVLSIPWGKDRGICHSLVSFIHIHPSPSIQISFIAIVWDIGAHCMP